MDRREFLRRAAIIASGAIAADQLELLERLTWQRKLFPSPYPYAGSLGEIQMLGLNGMVKRRLPWNGEEIIRILRDDSKMMTDERWMRVMLKQPASPNVAILMGPVAEGGTTYTLPLGGQGFMQHKLIKVR